MFLNGRHRPTTPAPSRASAATSCPGRRTDYPRRVEALPRFLPEAAVLEAPASLALLEDNGLRNAVKVLIGTGRRAQEVLSLAVHCAEAGPDGDPYLRFSRDPYLRFSR